MIVLILNHFMFHLPISLLIPLFILLFSMTFRSNDLFLALALRLSQFFTSFHDELPKIIPLNVNACI